MAKPTRLNLGSGVMRLDGWTNVDSDPNVPCDVPCDYRAFVRNLAELMDGVVEEVLMSHSLGFCSLTEARQLFRQLHQLMMIGGLLVIEGPDLHKCIQRMETATTEHDYIEGIRGIYGFDADLSRPYHPYSYGWEAPRLVWELQQAGFDATEGKARLHPPPCDWRDYRVEAVRR